MNDNELPNQLYYASTHEWTRVEGDEAVVGITYHAQSALGDVVYVELPDVGVAVTAGDEVSTIESVKAASEIYAPISGEIIEVNTRLENAPETVNTDPYYDGWLFRLKIRDTAELDDLLDADGYRKVAEEQ